jgi:hypothetical protein
MRQFGLRPLAGAALPDGDLPQLARDLLDEPEERRLLLTSRTFAPTRRTYHSLAAELGVGRERVRQLENLGAAIAGRRGRARPVPSAPLARHRPHDLEEPTPPRCPARRRARARCCPGWQKTRLTLGWFIRPRHTLLARR